MSESKHTPGPWVSSYYASDEFAPLSIDGCFAVGVGRFEQPVAMIWHGDENGAVVSEDEAEATANLIAAAPDLLQALKRTLSVADAYFSGVSPAWREEALAAIAKAEGKS